MGSKSLIMRGRAVSASGPQIDGDQDFPRMPGKPTDRFLAWNFFAPLRLGVRQRVLGPHAKPPSRKGGTKMQAFEDQRVIAEVREHSG